MEENDIQSKRDVFLCHAFEDKPMIRSVALGLERYGISIWFDEAEMRAGDILVEKVSTAISLANKFCVFLTSNSVQKNWVKFELNQAMQREISENTPFVIPVRLHECKLPHFLLPKMYIDLRNWDSYSLALEKLATAIKRDINDLPKRFNFKNLDNKNIDDQVIYSLPAEQAAIEFRLRYDNWTSRRIGTLRNYSGLTIKQVITYCEMAPYIILSPKFNSLGEIFYGVKWRVMGDQINVMEYNNNVNRFLMMMRSMIIKHKYSKDILGHFFSFYNL